MPAPPIFPTASSARPINPLVLKAFPHAAGEINSFDAYVAEDVLPPQFSSLDDSGDTGTIQRLADEEMIGYEDVAERAPYADIPSTSGVELDPITFRCKERSLLFGVDTQFARSVQGVNLYAANLAKIWHRLMIATEAELDTFLMAGTWHPSDGNTANKWNTSAGDPIKDIATAVGYVPGANVIVMNREVAMAVATNANIRTGTPDNQQSHFIAPPVLAAFFQSAFGLTLKVSAARKSVGGTESYILRDSVWIGRAGDSAIEVGPRDFRVGNVAAVRMGVRLAPTAGEERADVRASYIGDWLVEEWSEPRNRTRFASVGHKDVLKSVNPTAGWTIGDVL